jgi:hypothetical protein
VAIVATLVTALVGILGWYSQTQATDREHDSRKARELREEYKELDTEVGRYVKGAKLVYRASYQRWKATGRWPRGEDHGAYEAVIDAGTDVRRLQAGVRDRKVRKLLDALRSDVRELCAATSVRTANQASKRMMNHADAISVRAAVLRNDAAKRLGMLD